MKTQYIVILVTTKDQKEAAKIAKGKGDNSSPERQVRIACRDLFRRSGMLEKIIPAIEEILKAGGIDPPKDAPEAAEPAIPREEGMGDDGHTLSLFPGTEVVHEEKAWTKAFFLKAQDMYRITLTKSIVNRWNGAFVGPLL